MIEQTNRQTNRDYNFIYIYRLPVVMDSQKKYIRTVNTNVVTPRDYNVSS